MASRGGKRDRKALGKNKAAARSALRQNALITGNAKNKRYTPAQYARIKFQREERERVTGNQEGRRVSHAPR